MTNESDGVHLILGQTGEVCWAIAIFFGMRRQLRLALDGKWVCCENNYKMKKPARMFDYSSRILKAEWPNFLLWSYLLLPLFIRLFANYRYSKIDLLVFYTLGMSLLWLMLVRFISSSQFRVHLILLPFYLLATVDLFLVVNFNSRLTAAYIFIGLTNHKEAGDFLSTYWQSMSAVLVVFVVCYGAGLAGLHNRKSYQSKYVLVLAVSALLLGYGAYFYKSVKMNSFGKSAVMDLLAKDQSTPMGYLSQIALTTDLYLATEKHVKRRQASEVKLTNLSNQANIDNIVFVIGESSRPQNWSLYGYGKKTTPNLDKQAGIFKFNNICTTAPYTSFAVPSMLSLEPISDWESIASTKSLVSIFRAAGYMTYWLSAQEVDSFGGIIPQIAAEAQYRQYFERSYDGALIPEYEKILQNNDVAKKAIFIHIKGSHFEYSRRYPESFDKFKPSTDSMKDRMTAEYDNSILYTDWVLSTIIDRLSSSKKASVLFYSSDHGENMMDDSRGLLGHGIGNKYDLPVSAFIWASSNVSSQQSLKLLKLKEREGQKVSVSSLPHTLLSITGVFTNRYNSVHDLLSDDFVPSKCPHLLGAGYVPEFDFDAQ